MTTNRFPCNIASPNNSLFQDYIDDPQRTGALLNIYSHTWQILQMVLTLDGSERLGISEFHSILNMMKTFSSSVTNDSSVLGSGEVEFSQSQELGVQSVDYVQECGPAKNDAVCLLKLKDTVQSGLTIYNDCVPTFV